MNFIATCITISFLTLLVNAVWFSSLPLRVSMHSLPGRYGRFPWVILFYSFPSFRSTFPLSLFFTFLQTFGSLVVALFHGFSYLSSTSVRENERRKIFLYFTFPSLFYFFTVRSLNQPAYNTPNESPSLLSPSLYLQSLSLNLAEENLL